MLIIEAPYIAEIAPLDKSAPLTVYKTYTSPDFPDQYCVMIEGELKPVNAIQDRYNIILSLKPGVTLQNAKESPIKRMREACGLNQTQLAEKIGCTQKDVSRWENGNRNPSVRTIEKLSNVFGCTTDELTILVKHFKEDA